MECFNIKNLSFTYPDRDKKALDEINFSVNDGEFVCIMGKSGCGKTTLLKLLKTVIAPHGEKTGKIKFFNKPLDEYETIEQAAKIGFVLQNVEAQLVTDKVWHELSFGLENLGVPTEKIRRRVAEMASFFGIEEWFYKNVCDLSGGQKQILNLASIMVMQPDVLILDEPTSQLDPISAMEFLKTLERINKEIGTTIIIAEHRTEEIFSLCDRVIIMDDGKIIADDKKEKIPDKLKKTELQSFLPTGVLIYQEFSDGENYPITVRDAKKWLEEFSKDKKINLEIEEKELIEQDICIKIKDAWFRYERNERDVIKGLNLEVKKGEILSVFGGNGSGKTTMLSIISGINNLYRGKILVNGENILKIKNLYNGILGLLPQNPQTLFVKHTVLNDLIDIEPDKEKVRKMADLCAIAQILEQHPFDLSGGEQQRAALCKILLKNPEIVLLDEPTKGCDAQFKEEFKRILKNLKKSGKTIIIVSHDIDFCADISDRCALFFDGSIVSIDEPEKFFSDNYFYTTTANRIARDILPVAITKKDIINAFKN